MFFNFLFLIITLCGISARAQEFANSLDNNNRIKYHIVGKGETLHEIATIYDLGFDELVKANPEVENGNIIYIGQKLILPVTHLIPDAKHDGIIINLAELRLYFFHDDVARSFPISIGSDERTPQGTTKIISKKKDPSWRPPLSIREKKPDLPDIVPPGPDNPMGGYALYLDARKDIKWTGIAIHGTDNPSSIGSRVSLGCMRLYSQDIEELFDLIDVGTTVNIVNQEIKVDKVLDKIYLETHLKTAPDLVIDSWKIKDAICKKISDCENQVDWQKVDEVSLRNLGIPEQISY